MFGRSKSENAIEQPLVPAKRPHAPIGVSQTGASLIVTREGAPEDSATASVPSGEVCMSRVEGGKSADSLRMLVGPAPSLPVEVPQLSANNTSGDDKDPGKPEQSASWISSWKSQPGRWFSRSDPIATEPNKDATKTDEPLMTQTTQPVKTDPGKTQPTKAQPAKPETSKMSTPVEPAKSESPGSESENAPSRGSWAFWSSNKHNNVSADAEVAIEGTTSETHPEHVTIEQQPPQKQPKLEPGKRKPKRDHLLVPSIDTIPWQSKASYIKSFLTRRRNQRLLRVSPPHPARVVVVGVHGYFPARMTRAILGDPKGTSMKFANEAVEVVEKWFPDAEVEKIALEGEGKVNHRISTLYNLVLNWKESIRSADVVIFAAHSQGAVVSAQIIRKLLQDGLIDMNRQKALLLAMAGTFLGPMPGMDKGVLMKAISRIENESLMELFELQNIQSPLGCELLASLDIILSSGVKLVLCGSADDQLVPLYSALCIHVSHPNIFRVAYLDGDDVAPEVVSPILDLALRHKNRGETDHNLIVELSGPLAGALTSKGHSKLYDFADVYELGVRIATGTVPVVGEPIKVSAFSIPKPNPFVLPWAAHALLSTAERSKQDNALVQQIHKEYSEWRPQSKPMKELKFRLGALEAGHTHTHSAKL